jgi:murein DD-endopeptidase MepM/ murein hydrolase activator NlpD
VTKISLSGNVARCLVVGSLLVLLLTLYIFYDYAGIKRDRAELTQLRRQTILQAKEINSLALKIDEFSDRMEEFRQFDQKIRIMAKNQTGKGQKVPLGVGGPSNEQVRLKEMLDQDYDKLASGMHQSLSQLNKDADEREKSFQELLRFLQEQKSRLAATPSIWPVRGWVTSEFGPRENPFSSGVEFHKGLDIATRMGKEVVATGDGLVVEASYNAVDGNMVKIDHGYGISTSYLHLSKTAVQKGTRVKRGNVIGHVGDTGRSSGAHLHYCVSVNNVPVNPRKYLK